MNIVNFSQSSFKEFTGANIFSKALQKLELNNNQPQQTNISNESLPSNDDFNMTPESQQSSTLIKKTKQICEDQLKEKLIQLFRRNKQKNHEICDYFMNDLSLLKHCDNIQEFIHFIMESDAQPRSKATIGKYLKYQRDGSSISQGVTTNLRISNTKLVIFPENINFITSTFSRDKVQILLQLHGTNHKILNFLNFLLVSLRSFIYTNEKQWILMKDEVERYLSKYEHNVQKIYQIEDQQDENLPENENNNVDKLQWGGSKLQKTKQIKKISQEMKKKFSNNKLTLDHYKAETSKVRKKLIEHQQSMCSALRKACYSTYEKFKDIVFELRSEMIFIIGLIDKTERFKQSKEKYLIRQFLLESRKIGVESLIFLQQIYKHIVEKLESTRRKICFDVEEISSKGEVDGKRWEQIEEMLNEPKGIKQRSFVRQVERTFQSVESILLVKRTSRILLCNKQEQKAIELLNDIKQNGHKSNECIMDVNIFQVEEQQNKPLLKQVNQPSVIQSQDDKFISSVIGQDQYHHACLQAQAPVVTNNCQDEQNLEDIYQRQVLMMAKEKKIRKRAKSEQSLVIKQDKQVKRKGRKSKVQSIQQQHQLSIINSQDEHNQSSSSLQFLSLGAKQNPQQQKETKKQVDSDGSKNSLHQSMIKNNPISNKLDDFESISIQIPLSIHYEQGSINMDEFESSESGSKDDDSCRYESMEMESCCKSDEENKIGN